jgi:hypothetical protein
VKLVVIEVGRRFYRTHLWGNAIVLPLWGRVRIEPSRMETLQGSMSSGVLWGACKPLQCNSTCNINLFITLINQLGNKRQSPPNRGRNKLSRSSGRAGKTKARARWIPTSEASELIENWRCFSCKKKGHIARECFKYRPASRSAGVNYTTASEPVSDSKGSKSGSGYKAGKK